MARGGFVQAKCTMHSFLNPRYPDLQFHRQFNNSGAFPGYAILP